MFWFWFFFIICFIPLTIMLPTKVIGKFKKDKNKGAIVISNHYSNFDAIVLTVKLHKRISFLGKKELVKGRLSKWFFESVTGAIMVDRGAADIKATKKILGLLKENKPVGVFPEGTRNQSEEDKFEAKNGVCMFAIKSKTPITPMWIVRKPKVFRKNVILIGESFELSEFYNEKLTKEVLDKASIIITEKMMDLKKAYEEKMLEKEVIKKLKKDKKINKK